MELLLRLCSCTRNKQQIIQLGGINVLMPHLNSPDLRMKALTTLLNVSDVASKSEQPELLKQLIERFLDVYDVGASSENQTQQIVQAATGILMNLTCNNAVNKRAVVNCGGIGALLRVIQRYEAVVNFS